ncbi:MAG: hypothetical protein ACE5I2_05910 [Anaerolineae bacterium]
MFRKSLPPLFIVFLTGLLLATCGPATQPETTRSETVRPKATQPEATVSPPLETPVISPPEAEGQAPDKLAEAMEGAVIVYQRSGGIAGTFEQWIIYPDGRITTDDGREWQVAPEQVRQLLGDIEALGFFEMSDRYMPLNVCCDRFTYEITVRRGSEVKRVTTVDAAPNTPAKLWRIIEEISGLVSDLEGWAQILLKFQA